MYVAVATNASSGAYCRYLSNVIGPTWAIWLVLFFVKCPISQFISFLWIRHTLIICSLPMRSAIWVISIHHLLKEVIIHWLNIATTTISIAGCPIVSTSIRQTTCSCPIPPLTRIWDGSFSRLIILVIIKFAWYFSSKRYHWLWFIIWLSHLIRAWSICIGYGTTLISTFPRFQRRIRGALSPG